MNICVVGLGYVGLPTAIACSLHGHAVTGCDIDPMVIKGLRHKRTAINDSYVEDRLHLSDMGVSESLVEAEIYIVCVPTPVDQRLNPDLSAVVSAVESLAAIMPNGALVVLESTIYPGVCEETIAPILQKSGKRFMLAHCPERINPGDAHWHVENIPRVVGGMGEQSTKRAAQFYRTFVSAEVIEVSSVRAAEATKILENTFRDINIAFVNEMAMSFDRLGIDVTDVIRAASTKPFGFMPFYPGAGVGGHCIAVDPYYMIERGRLVGFQHEFLSLARRINEGMPAFTVGLLLDELKRSGLRPVDATVAVLGLAYKPDVADDRESPAYAILEELESSGCEVRVYDPYITNRLSVPTLRDAIAGASAALLVTAHQEFCSDPESFANCPIVIDGRNCLDSALLKSRGVSFRGIGR